MKLIGRPDRSATSGLVIVTQVVRPVDRSSWTYATVRPSSTAAVGRAEEGEPEVVLAVAALVVVDVALRAVVVPSATAMVASGRVVVTLGTRVACTAAPGSEQADPATVMTAAMAR